jgi:undecaprenyl-diphosphatase
MDKPHSLVAFVIAIAARADLCLLRLCIRSARPKVARNMAISFSWMGNGLIYPSLGVLWVAVTGSAAWVVISIATLNIGLLHSIYPSIKRRIARRRPFDADPNFAPLLRALDSHSFPSGHAMTLTAALIPAVLAIPEVLVLAIAIWCAMAWARLASTHHYPSDVLGGTALSFAVSYPISHYSLVFVS